jgi:hypothetical protein
MDWGLGSLVHCSENLLQIAVEERGYIEPESWENTAAGDAIGVGC